MLFESEDNMLYARQKDEELRKKEWSYKLEKPKQRAQNTSRCYLRYQDVREMNTCSFD
jgi:hypothetical protein